MKQRWMSVKGYEERYRISSDGVVQNTETGHTLKPQLWGGGGGYPTVTLCKPGKQIKKLLHRLLVDHFIAPLIPGFEVNHKDGNKMNFQLTNLERVTRKQNRDHAVRTGLLNVTGENNKRAKLTELQARKIKTSTGKIRDVAAQYGVTHRIVSLIRRGLLWRHL